MKICLTGHKGFIGKHLFRYLTSQGHTVIGIDKKEKRMNLSQFAIINKLLEEFKPDVVIHLAAVLNNNPLDNLIDNVVASVNVFEACKKNKIEWVIFVSSAAVYGDQTSPVTEQDIISPFNVYGASKHYIESIMSSYNFKKTILRLSNVYGDGGAGVVNQFTYRIKNNMPITIHGRGMQIRDYVHVKDVVGFIDAVLAGGKEGLFNVSTGLPTSIIAVTKLINNIKKGNCKYGKIDGTEIFYSCLKSIYSIYSNKIRLKDGIRELMEDG